MEKKGAKALPPPYMQRRNNFQGVGRLLPPPCAMAGGWGKSRTLTPPWKKNNSLYSGTFFYLLSMYVGGYFVRFFYSGGGGGLFHHLRAFFATFFLLWETLFTMWGPFLLRFPLKGAFFTMPFCYFFLYVGAFLLRFCPRRGGLSYYGRAFFGKIFPL